MFNILIDYNDKFEVKSAQAELSQKPREQDEDFHVEKLTHDEFYQYHTLLFDFEQYTEAKYSEELL